VAQRLVSTGVAAKALGVHRGTLHRWWTSGMVEPELVTAGGQARWDVERLRTNLRDLYKRDADDDA
jgi:DNA-binding transcriptional MerR regulator